MLTCTNTSGWTFWDKMFFLKQCNHGEFTGTSELGRHRFQVQDPVWPLTKYFRFDSWYDASQFINLFLSLSSHIFLISDTSPTYFENGLNLRMKWDDACGVFSVVPSKRQGLLSILSLSGQKVASKNYRAFFFQIKRLLL